LEVVSIYVLFKATKVEISKGEYDEEAKDWARGPFGVLGTRERNQLRNQEVWQTRKEENQKCMSWKPSGQSIPGGESGQLCVGQVM
jgi:hypothetical protein